MGSLIKRNLVEIQRLSAWRFYGFFLSLTHVLTFFFWRQRLPYRINWDNEWPLCFPFFPNCENYRFLDSPTIENLLIAYFVFALLTAILFLRKKWLQTAYWCFLILTLWKVCFFIQDYTLMGNYHYMPFVISFLFLAVPRKSFFIPLTLVLFYVSAGFLKLNPEWLSGAAMIKAPAINGWLLSLGLYLVVLLEIALVWGLFDFTKKLRYSVLIALAGFHIFSWHIVGYFYPLIMFCLLSIFILDRNYFIKVTENKRDLIIYSLFFLFVQLAPHLFVKDPALDGKARFFSLNMFDAYTECKKILLGHRQGQIVSLPLPPLNFGVRTQCDTVVMEEVARTYCKTNQKEAYFDKITLTLISKRRTDPNWTEVLNEVSCKQSEELQ